MCRKVSVLFNEPKLLKFLFQRGSERHFFSFSALQRAEIAEIIVDATNQDAPGIVSVLFNEPKLLKYKMTAFYEADGGVSVLFNEPKLLKSAVQQAVQFATARFSALQRAEIAEICRYIHAASRIVAVSVLFNEPKLLKSRSAYRSPKAFCAFQCSSTSRNC